MNFLRKTTEVVPEQSFSETVEANARKMIKEIDGARHVLKTIEGLRVKEGSLSLGRRYNVSGYPYIEGLELTKETAELVFSALEGDAKAVLSKYGLDK